MTDPNYCSDCGKYVPLSPDEVYFVERKHPSYKPITEHFKRHWTPLTTEELIGFEKALDILYNDLSKTTSV